METSEFLRMDREHKLSGGERNLLFDIASASTFQIHLAAMLSGGKDSEGDMQKG